MASHHFFQFFLHSCLLWWTLTQSPKRKSCQHTNHSHFRVDCVICHSASLTYCPFRFNVLLSLDRLLDGERLTHLMGRWEPEHHNRLSFIWSNFTLIELHFVSSPLVRMLRTWGSIQSTSSQSEPIPDFFLFMLFLHENMVMVMVVGINHQW